jgi:hypothetical protein
MGLGRSLESCRTRSVSSITTSLIEPFQGLFDVVSGHLDRASSLDICFAFLDAILPIARPKVSLFGILAQSLKQCLDATIGLIANQPFVGLPICIVKNFCLSELYIKHKLILPLLDEIYF